LVNSGHRDVVTGAAGDPSAGEDYRMGAHSVVRSLVVPVDDAVLDASDPFRVMSAELAASPMAGKVAWDILPRRRGKLHATLCGMPLSCEWREAFRAIGPIAIRVGGPFSGNVNVGRIYLKLYPQERDGLSLLHALQDAAGQNRRDMHLVGLWSLTDHLDVAEAAWLADWLRRWGDETVATFTLTELWVLAARDDLVLDSMVEEVVPLA
jgi:hypothetical protein